MSTLEELRTAAQLAVEVADTTDRAAGESARTAVELRRLIDEYRPPRPDLPAIGVGFGSGLLPDPADVPRVADEMLGMGITRIRATLPWSSCQPKATSPITVPARYRQIMEAFDAAGVRQLVIPAYTPTWAKGVETPTGLGQFAMPKDPALFGAFCSAAVDQLPTVDEWEVWNEPSHNGPPGLVSPDRGRDYARLLDATWTARAFPRTHTVHAMSVCPAPDNPPTALRSSTFVEAVYAADSTIGDKYDQLSVHPYTGTLPFGVGPPHGWVSTQIPEIRAKLRAAGERRPRIISATECGYSTKGPNAYTEQQQADRLVDMIQTWRSQPDVGPMWLFSWNDLSAGTTRSDGLGLHTHDGTPKRACAAIREALT